MKAVLDTNVLVSGIFFGGVPREIIRKWHNGDFRLFVTPAILDEYRRVTDDLADRYRVSDTRAILDLIALNATVMADTILPQPVCEDADDDKFVACAISCGAKLIVSGDKHLLRVSGYQGIEVLKPKPFILRLV